MCDTYARAAAAIVPRWFGPSVSARLACTHSAQEIAWAPLMWVGHPLRVAVFRDQGRLIEHLGGMSYRPRGLTEVRMERGKQQLTQRQARYQMKLIRLSGPGNV